MRSKFTRPYTKVFVTPKSIALAKFCFQRAVNQHQMTIFSQVIPEIVILSPNAKYGNYI